MTGVQTCALPIYRVGHTGAKASWHEVNFKSGGNGGGEGGEQGGG